MTPVIEFYVNVFSVAFAIWLFTEWLVWGLKRDEQELEDYLDSYLQKDDEKDEEF